VPRFNVFSTTTRAGRHPRTERGQSKNPGKSGIENGRQAKKSGYRPATGEGGFFFFFFSFSLGALFNFSFVVFYFALGEEATTYR